MVLSPLLVLPSALVLTVAPRLLPDVYVDGSQANCGTGNGQQATPVCTIGEAVAIASPGDVIRIAPGTYVENVSLGMDLDLVGTGGASVTIVDGGALGPVISVGSTASCSIDGLTITNGVGNGAVLTGGGVSSFGFLTISNSTITGNSSPSYPGGGGLAQYGGSLDLVSCEVSDNETVSYGGGIWARGADLTITDSILEDNECDAAGGGIRIDGGELVLTSSSILGNVVTSGYGGGISAVYETGASRLIIDSSTISGNSADAGGGIDVIDCGFEITNSTISSNTADLGAGILTFFMPAGSTLDSCTIAWNNSLATTTTTPGGVHNWTNSASIATRNTIIAANTTALSASNPDVRGPFTSLGHNLIGVGVSQFIDGVNGNIVGTLNSPVNPLIGVLQDNGGSTPTHLLSVGSPAIDAGDPVVFEALDQRGVSRPVGVAPDIGATEGVAVSSGIDSFCNGDGGDQAGCTDCPCNNNAMAGTTGGCLNSVGTSARLVATGTRDLSSADLRFEGAGFPATAAAVLLSTGAAAPNNPMNPCFGMDSGIQSTLFDGLRCGVTGTLRHGLRVVDANGEIGVLGAGWGDPDAFLNFSAFVAGSVRHFQAVYRDDPDFVCNRGLNTTQGVRVGFVP